MSRAVGNLRVDLVATLDKFESVLQRAGKDAVTFGVTVGGAGKKAADGTDAAEKSAAKASKALTLLRTIAVATFAAIGVRAVIADFNEAAETVDKLGKTAKRLGVDVGSLSVLRFAAGEAGVDFDTLAKFAGKAERGISEFTRTGGGPAADAFARLGVPLRDVNGQIRALDDLLPEIGKAMAGMGSQAEKLDVAEKIFGKEGGAQFVTWLEDSGGAMENLAFQAERARRLGVVFDNDQVQKLTAYNDAVRRIGEAWLGLRVKVMTSVAPFLTAIADKASAFIAAIPKLIGNTVSLIGDAMGGDKEAQARLTEFFSAFKGVVVAGMGQVGATIVATGVWVFRLATDQIFDDAEDRVDKHWERMKAVSKAGATAFLAGVVMGSTGGQFGGDILQGAQMQMDAAHAMDVGSTPTSKLASQFSKAFQTDFREGILPAVSDLNDETAAATKRFGVATEAAFGFSAALKSTSQDANDVAAAIHGIGVAAPKAASNLDNFVFGVKQGFTNLSNQAEQFGALGTRVTEDWARGLSDGLGAALVQSGANFRNFGKAALGVLGDVSKAAAQAIIQFMILRAVTGIGVAAFAPSTPINTESFGGANAAAYAPTTGQLPHGGGMMTPSGAIHRAGGGGIPGARTNTDSVHTMTTPGEYVVNATDADRTLPTLSAINKGGSACVVQVIDQRQSGAAPQVQRSRGPEGQELIRVLILDEFGRAANSGLLDKVMKNNFGATRPGVRRG